MSLDPSDGVAQAIVERDGWLPAQFLHGFAVIGDQTLHFGALWAEALVVSRDFDRFANERDDHLGEVTDGDLGAGAQVEDFAGHFFELGGFKEAVDRIIHIGEVAGGCEVAKLDFGLGERLGDDGGDDRAGGLTGPVGIERANGDSLDGIGAGVTLDQFVSADLAGGVG